MPTPASNRSQSKAEAYKRNEQKAWNRFCRRYTQVALPEFQPYGQRLVQMAELRRGMWVLDVATGPGEPALTVAGLVGPSGLVVGVDFSAAMLKTAVSRARRSGIRNTQFRKMDAERLKFPDMMFDRVFCRFGLMLMPNAEQAMAEMYRVLVPGGRVLVALWSIQTKVNTMGIVRKVLVDHDAFTPSPGAPDFFRFGKAGAIERVLRNVGFKDIHSERMTIEWVFADPEDFWKSMKQGPSLSRALARLSPARQRAVKEKIVGRLARFMRRGALRIPNEAVLAMGQK
jgi:ubiquinone/menaquinone biosynthesis C-methylase UbiE